jgi:hypothetical protein
MPTNLNPSDLANFNTFEKANIMTYREKHGLGAPVKVSRETEKRIEEMFTLIQEKTSAKNE